jgi:hypothetical protein
MILAPKSPKGDFQNYYIIIAPFRGLGAKNRGKTNLGFLTSVFGLL